MSTDLRIRRAEARDVPRLLELLLQVNNIHHALRPDLFVENRTKYGEAVLLEMLEDPGKPIFVAETAEQGVQGYLFAQIRLREGLNLTGGSSFYIDDLCVSEAVRGTGIGTALLDFGKQYAKENGCREVLLNVWEGNETAIRFYVNHGFAPRSHLMEWK